MLNKAFFALAEAERSSVSSLISFVLGAFASPLKTSSRFVSVLLASHGPDVTDPEHLAGLPTPTAVSTSNVQIV